MYIEPNSVGLCIVDEIIFTPLLREIALTTTSSIHNRIHGSTILENLKQEVERSDEEVRNMHAEMKAEAVVGSEVMTNGEMSMEQMLERAEV